MQIPVRTFAATLVLFCGCDVDRSTDGGGAMAMSSREHAAHDDEPTEPSARDAAAADDAATTSSADGAADASVLGTGGTDAAVDAAVDDSAQKDAEAAPVPPPPSIPVWTAESTSVEISWFSFWAGGYRFTRERDQLSAAQLELLAAIRTIDVDGPCLADVDEVQLTITSNSGETETYGAIAHPCAFGSRTLVGYEEVAALLDTVDCLSAKGYEGGTLESAPHIVTGDGCHHGMFNAYTQVPEWWFILDVAVAGRYRIGVDLCADRQLQIDVLDETAASTLATVQTTSADCPTLEYDFPTAGSYALHVDMLGGDDAGDFYLHVDPVP
jgi:hypothetical protein